MTNNSLYYIIIAIIIIIHTILIGSMRVLKNLFVFCMHWLKALVLSLYVIFCFNVKAQVITNLINNPSFESYSACPTGGGQLKRCFDWFDPAIYSSPDYFNVCASLSSYMNVPNSGFGYHTARTGNAYAGFGAYLLENFTIGREYVASKTKQTLKPNKVYCINFFISLAGYSRFAIRNVGFHFTKDSIYNSFPPPSNLEITLNPSFEVTTGGAFADTLNWIQVQGTFLATGVENYLAIGNFRDTANTFKQQVKPLLSFPNSNFAYYYIEDVSVIEINPAKAYSVKSVTVCANTTFTLGTDSTQEATYQWQPAIGLSCTNCPNPILTASANTKYVLTKQQCSATTKDSVYIQIYTPTLTANAGNFKNICLNDTVKLGVNDTTAYTSYTWQPLSGLSCTNCPQPVTMPLTTTTYTLNKKECSFNTSDTVSVFVEPCEVIIPDIFTPNNDNVNDEWKIKLPNGFKLKTVAVYNRWGTLVYTIDDTVLSSEKSKVNVINWDGRTNSGLECSEGVYFYVINYTDKSGELKKLKGNVTLMR